MILPNLAAPVQRGDARGPTSSEEEGRASIQPSWFEMWQCGTYDACAYGIATGGFNLSAAFGCKINSRCVAQRNL